MTKRIEAVTEDLLFLYELALTVGRSLDLEDNCRSFLGALQRHKAILFGSVWLLESSPCGSVARLAYAVPSANQRENRLAPDHAMVRAVRDVPHAVVNHTDPTYDDFVTENGLGAGTYTMLALGQVGILKLYSAHEFIFGHHELNQFRAVVDRLSVAVEASIEHAELQRAEAAVQLSEARFRDFAEASADWFWETDSTLRLTYVSENHDRVTGLDADTMLGSIAGSQWPPCDEVDSERALFTACLVQPREVVALELRWEGGDGKQRVQSFNGKPVFREGNFTGFRGSVTDITERAQAKDRQERLESQLKQAQKMEAIGQLTGGIAHDFNNILGAVLGFTELARDAVQPSDTQMDHYLEEIQTAGERAKNLVAQMLTYSRGGTGVIEDVSVAPMLSEAIRLLRSTLPSTIEVNLRVLTPDAVVRSESVSLQQVLINLCINARDAMAGQKGTIDVSLERHDGLMGHCDSCHAMVDGSWAVLTVRDTGSGIDESTLARMFEPFYSTKAVGKGTGMGLPMVHGIVHRHHGHVRVDSRVGQGTVIRVYWPVLTGAPASKQRSQPRMQLVSGRGEKILVVDDEDSVGEVIGELLERRGYRAVITREPEKALEWVSNDPDRFDMLITDQTMPGLTGQELIFHVRALCPSMPVILSTGYSDIVEESVGPNGAFLRKPVSASELLSVVQGLLSQSKHVALPEHSVPASGV
jgi:PAS domain S-box-containing protein